MEKRRFDFWTYVEGYAWPKEQRRTPRVTRRQLGRSWFQQPRQVLAQPSDPSEYRRAPTLNGRWSMVPFGLGAIEEIGVPYHLTTVALKLLNVPGIPFPDYLVFVPEVHHPGIGEFVLPFRPGITGPHIKPDGVDRHRRGGELLEYVMAYPTGTYGAEGSSGGKQQDKPGDTAALVEKVLQLLNIVKLY